LSTECCLGSYVSLGGSFPSTSCTLAQSQYGARSFVAASSHNARSAWYLRAISSAVAWRVCYRQNQTEVVIVQDKVCTSYSATYGRCHVGKSVVMCVQKNDVCGTSSQRGDRGCPWILARPNQESGLVVSPSVPWIYSAFP
jgi:hypothetical protein